MDDRSEVRPLVRTAEEPMAFTFIEFLRGAVLAWVGVVVVGPLVTVPVAMLAMGRPRHDFSGLNDLGYAILASVSGSAFFYVPLAFMTLVVAGIPLGWLLGFALRRISSKRVHVAAFALLGGLIGAGTTLLVDTGSSAWSAWVGDVPLYTNTIVTALIVVASWSLAVTWAFSDDARPTTREDRLE